MSEPLRIPVETLREMCGLLIDHLAETDGEHIELERDYFWSLGDDRLYDVYNAPGQLGVGQLSESWEHLLRLRNGEVEVPTRHLVWLSEILRAVGSPVTRTRLEP